MSDALRNAEWVDAVMGQAQVFASAWSLVGGRFDSGNGLADAEEAKKELRAMLTAAATPPALPLAAGQIDLAVRAWFDGHAAQSHLGFAARMRDVAAAWGLEVLP